MKKIYLLAAFAIATSFSFAQRSFDVSVALSTPTSMSTVPKSSSQNISFSVTATGDDLVAGDTVFVYYLNFTQSEVYALDGTAGYVSIFILDATQAAGFSSGTPIPSSALGVTTLNTNAAGFNNGDEIDIIVEIGALNTNPGTDSDMTNNWDGFFLGTAGVEEITNLSLVAFPVPALDVLTVSGEESIASIVVYGLDGKVVATAEGDKVDVANLTSGVYVYEATSVSGVKAMSKFVKK